MYSTVLSILFEVDITVLSLETKLKKIFERLFDCVIPFSEFHCLQCIGENPMQYLQDVPHPYNHLLQNLVISDS